MLYSGENEKLGKFNENIALIEFEDENKIFKWKYKDLVLISEAVIAIISRNKVQKNEVIGISYPETSKASSIPIILGILNSSCGFCFIKSSDKKLLEEVRFVFGLENELEFLEELASCQVLNQKIKFYRNHQHNEATILLENLAYIINTSGTTGNQKIVRVPYSSILPNILGLQNTFQLSEKDIIFLSAPRTFDVFVVDLFLALISGSSLLVLDQKLKYSSTTLDLLFPASSLHSGVTFMQMTPSLFKMWNLEEIKRILHSDSSLRCLVLGGENFPTDIKNWQDWKRSRKRIFNIYGITEVSCWATIHEVTESDLHSNFMPIGKPIDPETILELQEREGGSEILIGSKTRICLIDDEDSSILSSNHPVFRETGDLAELSDGSIKIVGRSNEIVKRFGIRTNLKRVEVVALSFHGISQTSCIFHKEKLILFYKTQENSQNPIQIKEFKKFLRKNLKDHEFPDNLLEIDEMPLSAHGKISKTKLIERFLQISSPPESVKKSPKSQFLEEIQAIFDQEFQEETKNPENIKKIKSNVQNSFKSLGGTSVDALKIVMKLEDDQKCSFPQLLGFLLDDAKIIQDVLSYLGRFNEVVKPQHQIEGDHSFNFKIQAQFDLKKCVDASPTYSEELDLVCVGSHSHLVANLTGDLKIVSLLEVGDRVEGSVSIFKESQGLVGCYDGLLYCYDLFNGKVLWKFNSGAMIKSRSLCLGNLIIFGNYSNLFNLWCLDSSCDTPSLKWKLKIGEKGILANPLSLEADKIFVATLDGSLCTLHLDGEILWMKKMGSPVFADPSLVPGSREILVSEVSNVVHCFDFDGMEIWNFKTGGNIFSSFEFLETSENHLQISFGCHDKNLYCLDYNLSDKSVEIQWKVELQSQIFASPKKMVFGKLELLVVSTTNGHLNLVDPLKGKIKATFQLPGEVFSTPAISGNKIFIGCRNNFLYFIEVF